MNIRRCALLAYGALLHLYPSSFRKRFAPEMLQLAEAAQANEWPLIFGDTGVSVIRCWFEGTHSGSAPAENSYTPVGVSRISASVFLPGLLLAMLIIAGFSYASYRWPPPCPDGVHLVTRIVGPSQAKAASAHVQRDPTRIPTERQ